jgi:cell division protein FtsI (penicillin-binding protein 3)
VPGYEVAGKTGTADKPKKSGGYYKDKVVNTFAAMFPASNPQYVLIVTLDEPQDDTLSRDAAHGGLDGGAGRGRDHPARRPA